MRELEKILDKFYKKLRSYNNDIDKENHVYIDEVMNKYYNLGWFIPTKRYMCYIKDYLNDNHIFKQNIKNYKNYNGDIWKYKEERICLNCNLECNKKLHPHFEFFSAVFVMDIENRNILYTEKDKKELTILFFKQFSFDDGELKYNEERMMNLFNDYDLDILDKRLLENDCLTNIKYLLNIKNIYDNLILKFKNLQQNESSFLDTHNKFIKNKLEFYQELYKVEKELQNHNNNSLKGDKIKNKIDPIFKKLNEYGFSDLEMLIGIDVKMLTYHIFSETLPYQIAYLYFLGFIRELQQKHCSTQTELHKLLAKIIDRPERSIKGNINVLRNEKSKDRKDYKAYTQVENVKNHYILLK